MLYGFLHTAVQNIITTPHKATDGEKRKKKKILSLAEPLL